MKKLISYENSKITSGFWEKKQRLVRDVSLKAVYDRFSETGRFRAFDFSWKEGEPDRPHIFWDSDVAKWLESAAYVLNGEKNPEIEAVCDSIIEKIAAHQEKNGYFNIYFTVVEPEARFTRRTDHELYCAGHLIEAAVEYYKVTGKKLFLDCMCKYADYIEKIFKIKGNKYFSTPGHEEIELALVKLHDITGEMRYLELAKFFIDKRGCEEEANYGWAQASYNQSHLPCREQKTAEGHSVRAVYLYSGMADIAYKYGDEALKQACRDLFENIINKRMYITGGIGSTRVGEAFTIDYDLPPATAYTESCASIGLALFARRMQLLYTDSVYAEIIEKIIYNGFLSSISLDGKSFFYENPLEILPELHKVRGEIHYPSSRRSEVFDCSCCPPNITRFMASVADFLYTADDENNTVYLHQFMNSDTKFILCDKEVKISQKTSYPENGIVKINYSGPEAVLAVRIPSWSNRYEAFKNPDGYAYFNVFDGFEFEFDFAPQVRFIEADPRVTGCENRCAVSYGPVIYCMEGIDNISPLRDIRLDSDIPCEFEYNNSLDVQTLCFTAYRRKFETNKLYSLNKLPLETIKARMIPYYSFANRDYSEMVVWCLTR